MGGQFEALSPILAAQVWDHEGSGRLVGSNAGLNHKVAWREVTIGGQQWHGEQVDGMCVRTYYYTC